MESPPSISSMVEKAVSSGLKYEPPERRRDKAAREAEQRAIQALLSYNPADDSDFDDYCLSDYVWNKYYKHEDVQYDQYIFNLFRQDKIDTQERKVNITTAICVRKCPQKADEIAMWSKLVKPVLSKAPRKRKHVDREKSKRDAELDKILAEAAEEMAEQSDDSYKPYKRQTRNARKRRRTRK